MNGLAEICDPQIGAPAAGSFAARPMVKFKIDRNFVCQRHSHWATIDPFACAGTKRWRSVRRKILSEKRLNAAAAPAVAVDLAWCDQSFDHCCREPLCLQSLHTFFGEMSI